MYWHKKLSKSFPGDSPVKNPPANAGDMGQIPNQDPTCHVATKPVRHNYWACALEPENCNYWSLCAESPRSTTTEANTMRSPHVATRE